MRQAVIVIGCSYGDEGKGLAAFHCAGRRPGACLNVLINGGAQRGHTVDLPDGRRHVFHHFGSGSLAGAVSYADEDFLVNPLLFVREEEELEAGFGVRPRLVISDKCRVTTPWDMMLGQIIEENRGKKRFGSCGCGIFETILRYRRTSWALRWEELSRLSRREYLDHCRRILREYLPGRLQELGMEASPAWREVLESEGLAEHTWRDLRRMARECGTCGDWPSLAAGYGTIIFEAGQGLALDACNEKDFPHLTPSRTTSLISARRIRALPGGTETEILYVTRSYLTRHGAGPFPTECPKERIDPLMEDRTNIPNPHQQTLRYGLFDGEAVLERVRADREETMKLLPGAEASILVTHLNETKGALAGDMRLSDLLGAFDRAYLSDSPWAVRPAVPREEADGRMACG